MPAPRSCDSLPFTPPHPPGRRREGSASRNPVPEGGEDASPSRRGSETALSADDPFVGVVILGGLRLDARIGAGSSGIVYRGIEGGTGARCAVKRLAPHLQGDAEARSRLRREAQVSRAIAHPAVIDVRLYAEPEGFGPCLVMELLEGRSLDQLLAERGRLELAEVIDLLAPALEALGSAHARGILHRDIKPQNLFVVDEPEGPRARILDFGLAHVEDPTSIVTGAGLIFGSAPYLSPEAARGEAIDARADVYSLGVLLYELLSGRRPFRSSSTVALLMDHLKTTPAPIRSLPGAESIPPRVARLVHRALEKDPDRRPRDASAFLSALLEASGGGASGRPREASACVARDPFLASATPRGRGADDAGRRRRWGAGGLAALALAAIAAVATAGGAEAIGGWAPAASARQPGHALGSFAQRPRAQDSGGSGGGPASAGWSPQPPVEEGGGRSGGGADPMNASAERESVSEERGEGERRPERRRRRESARRAPPGPRSTKGTAAEQVRSAPRAAADVEAPPTIPMPELLPYRPGGPISAAGPSSP